MIDISKTDITDELVPSGKRPVLVINSRTIVDSYCHSLYAHRDDDRLNAIVNDVDGSQELLKETFESLGKYFTSLSCRLPKMVGDFCNRVSFHWTDMNGNPNEGIYFNLNPALAHWTRPWSYAQYLISLKETISREAFDGMKLVGGKDLLEFDLLSLSEEAFHFDKFRIDCPINELVQHFSAHILKWHEVAEQQLRVNLDRGSLVTFFQFPPEIRVPCEQYLQYFAQFLSDLGIDADTDLRSEAGRVLFSVTPHSGEEALTTIRQALDMYLQLPQRPDLDPQGQVDVAGHQLQANVLHLRSQLMLGAAMIQAKDAAIQAHQANIRALELQVYQSHQLIQSLKAHEAPTLAPPPKIPQTDVTMFGDTVKLTKFTVKGVEIDLPNIYRRLRRRLAGQDRTD